MKIIYVFYTDILTCACVYIYTHINTYLYIHLYVIWGEKKDDPKIHSIYLTLVQWKGYGHSPCTVENLHKTTSRPSAYVNSQPGIKNTVVSCPFNNVCLNCVGPLIWYSATHPIFYPINKYWSLYSKYQRLKSGNTWLCKPLLCCFVWDILCINQRISKTPYISTYFLLHTTLFHVFSLQNSVFKNNNYEKKYM